MNIIFLSRDRVILNQWESLRLSPQAVSASCNFGTFAEQLALSQCVVH